MKRRFLGDCLAKGMSLEAIGELAGRHPSTVGYWLKKHGLKASNAERHAGRGGLDREELEALVERGLAFRQIAARVGRSVATVRHWMGVYGLETIYQERRRVPDQPKRTQMSCRRHGKMAFVREGLVTTDVPDAGLRLLPGGVGSSSASWSRRQEESA